MAPRARQRTYGNTRIGGNARVQLGDRQVTRNIKIERACIRLQNRLESSDIEAIVQALRIRASPNDPTSSFTQPQIQGSNHGPASLSLIPNVEAGDLDSINGREHDLRGGNAVTACDTVRKFSTPTSNATHIYKSDESPKSRIGVPSSAVDAPRPRGVLSELSSLPEDSCDGASVALKSLSWLSQALSWSRLTDFLALPTLKLSPPLETANIHRCEPKGELVKSDMHTCATNDLPMLLTGILSYIVGQNLSVKDVSHLLIICQEHQLLGLVTCVIWIGLYRYFMARRLVMAPSYPDKLFLEDAYGRSRSFSPDICADFDILTRFLEVHYRDTAGTTAGVLVTAGQFYLMLGSRRGRAFSRRDWRNLVLKPGYKLVNSVYISRDNMECLICHITMTVTPSLGEFHCPLCKAYHRDCDTINSSAKGATTPSDINVTTTATESQPHSSTSRKREPKFTMATECDSIQSDSLAEIAHDTSGLVNLDLKLRPRRQREMHSYDDARVMYAFSGGDENYLQVVKGQIVTVLLKSETNNFLADQWYLCKDNFGMHGYVPRTYLNIIDGSTTQLSTRKWARIVARHTGSARNGFGIPPPIPTSSQEPLGEDVESTVQREERETHSNTVLNQRRRRQITRQYCVYCQKDFAYKGDPRRRVDTNHESHVRSNIYICPADGCKFRVSERYDVLQRHFRSWRHRERFGETSLYLRYCPHKEAETTSIKVQALSPLEAENGEGKEVFATLPFAIP